MLEIGTVELSWREMLDVGLVALVYYYLLSLIKGTRAVSVLYGLVLLLLVYYASDELGLATLNWFLANFLSSIFLVVIILFQADIRKALAQVGGGRFWRKPTIKSEILDELVAAFLALAKAKIGGIVVLEKNESLGEIVQRGVELDSVLTKELLLCIFEPGTPLHDGAVIVRGGRLAAASCILPLTTGIGRAAFGTRHRAAIGISEESDAIAVVASEERGEISVAVGGKLTTALDEKRLRRVLKTVLEK
jgi:uncharacterized protein (TIGR00159 family)